MTDTPQPRIVYGPAGGEFIEPPTMPAGEQAPPMGVKFVPALTEPDAAGRIFVVWQFGDDTIASQVRMPWQVAVAFAQSVLAQTAQVAARAQAVAGPQLWRPGMGPPPGMPPGQGVNGHG